jgi:ribonuclease BN (tRNA processing enzyme)
VRLWLVLAGGVAASLTAACRPAAAPPPATRVVMLGTGTPNADPDRSGPSVAVVVHGAAYLVDAGPGVVRRAAAAHRAGIAELAQPNLKVVFITHLHSDHTAGLADLVFSPWVLGREAPLAVYGPTGVADMVDHLQRAYAQDVRIRVDGLEPANTTGWRAVAHEVAPGEVYRDSNVTVTAFAVPHGSWPQAFGYTFATADRTIVISGDTRRTEAIVEQCRGCDVLVHEVYSDSGFAQLEPEWQRYHSAFHTPASQLGDLATRAQPKLLVLYHGLPWSSSPAEIVRTVRARWSGRVVYANDLDIF